MIRVTVVLLTGIAGRLINLAYVGLVGYGMVRLFSSSSTDDISLGAGIACPLLGVTDRDAGLVVGGVAAERLNLNSF